MHLDRQLQYKILNIAAEHYPDSVFSELNQLYNDYGEKAFVANLKYLEQQNLIEKNSLTKSLDNIYSINQVTMTHRGMDFLADDGGLGAILNVVTVKFEADTLKAILESRITQSDLTPADKQSMIDALRELPAESIKHLTTKLLDAGLDNLPNAIVLIGTYLGLS